MDKKISRIGDVLDALDAYFGSLSDYLKQVDRDKYTRIEHGMAECRRYKTRFDAIRADDAGRFEAVHLYASMIEVLDTMYHMLDFELPVGEEISKTRAYRLTEVFNRVTTLYRTMMRDLVVDTEAVVHDAAAHTVSRDPLVLQGLWQRWPNSIDLYTLKMAELLDQSYHDHDAVRTQQIHEILESDKRYILREETWISAFLSFNCVPWSRTPTPVPWVDVVKLLADAGVTAVAAKTADADLGRIVVTRHQSASRVHLLPRALEFGPGITTDDIQPAFQAVDGASWHWSVRVVDTAKITRYLIVESLADDQWRVLVPWKRANPVVTLDLIIYKIKAQTFGRPEAYHKLLERSLRAQLSTRVAVISSEEARPHDVSLSVLTITDRLVQAVKAARGTVLSRLDDERIDKVFETSVLEELSKHDIRRMDAVLYWADWLRRSFRKDLDNLIEKAEGLDVREMDAVMDVQVEKMLNTAVSAQLRREDNVFKDLFDKEHKIREVETHTRRITGDETVPE